MNKQHLSGPNQWLIEQCQHINFGRITFRIRDGELDLSRPYHTVRTVKSVGGENGPRPEAGSADFELRKEHTALLAKLAQLEDGTCVTLRIAYGLPNSSIDIEEDYQVA